ncbi:hypothetical protein H8F10_13765 [Vibrio fluvialis]|uniref:hypothetical protein n=1 Tax=Vibrio fluvialis TaxID=676 RepID=UPI00192B7939|nr:hypothetical protein [Vibrio fluvialis]MBL4278982.1 hypothetical protein [Vibrio fluvialis]
MSRSLTSRLTLGKKMSNESRPFEVRDLALALRDLLEVIDGRTHIGEIPIKECRAALFAHKMLDKARESKDPNFVGV